MAGIWFKTHDGRGSENINQQLNREFVKGMRGIGNITGMDIATIYPQSNWLMVRVRANGNFELKVSGAALSF